MEKRKAGKLIEAPKAAQFTDEQLEQIAADTRRLDHSSRIIYWDKRQGERSEGGGYADTVIMCPNDPHHGPLQMHGSGALLICQSRKSPGVYCTATHPVSL